MKKYCLYLLSLLVAVVTAGLLMQPMVAKADNAGADGVVEIYTAEDLQNIAKDPAGSYILMNDIDMRDVSWKPFTFSGDFNGNGYALLNLQLRDAGDGTMQTYDGNRKVYDTSFCGLFDILSGSVKDLTLHGVQGNHTSDVPVFLGSIAGYLDGGTIDNCNIDGILMLHAHDRMFGVGGIAGYGQGTVNECKADITLVCIDTDKETRDEQFLGGVVSAGYPSITSCEIQIDGYDSDHGYVHNGGLVGMYIYYGEESDYKGAITNNSVKGKITFYEDNTNRRAYCKPFIGEIMNYTYVDEGNTEEFLRDEVYCYDVDLMPMKTEIPREDPATYVCEHTNCKEEVVKAQCHEFGYTKHICETCGYEWKDTYTLKEHSFEWNMIKEPTLDEEGINEGVCTVCGEKVEEAIPKLTEEEYEAIAEEETSEIAVEDESKASLLDKLKEKNYILMGLIALGAAAILGIGATLIRVFGSKKQK